MNSFINIVGDYKRSNTKCANHLTFTYSIIIISAIFFKIELNGI